MAVPGRVRSVQFCDRFVTCCDSIAYSELGRGKIAMGVYRLALLSIFYGITPISFDFIRQFESCSLTSRKGESIFSR